MRRPSRPHDAHRPLESEHDLDEILRWKEQRKLTSNRTLHYRRTVYLVQDTDAARRAAGKMVDVHEHEDGSVVIRYAGEVLPATAFRKDGHVTPQDIESNKYLGRALAQIREAQVATGGGDLVHARKEGSGRTRQR